MANARQRADLQRLLEGGSDGFLEPAVAAVTAVISVVIVAMSLRAARTELGDRQVPLAGITAAFVFAAQMFNFPVASGTSGHLLGGALAAILTISTTAPRAAPTPLCGALSPISRAAAARSPSLRCCRRRGGPLCCCPSAVPTMARTARMRSTT